MPRRSAPISQQQLANIFSTAKRAGYPRVRVSWQNASGDRVEVVAEPEVTLAPDNLDRELAEFEARHGGTS